MMPYDLSGKTLRILHVDDDEEDHIIMRTVLAEISDWSAEVDWVADYDTALQKLLRNEHDLCLLDYSLGSQTGLDLLKQAAAEGCRVPFIMLTGTGNRGIDLESMENGVSFYIDKNHLDVNDLERTIRYSLENARLLKSLHELNDDLEQRVLERTHLLLQAKEQLEAEIMEREKAEAELRRLRYERDQETLQQIARFPRTTVTARLLGVRSLKESDPDFFEKLVVRYGQLLDIALEQLAFRVESRLSDELRALAEQVGSFGLSPRDLVEIHDVALRHKTDGTIASKAQVYIEEGRLIILELMGHLASYYRNFASLGTRKFDIDDDTQDH